jgi:hypothetical protein
MEDFADLKPQKIERMIKMNACTRMGTNEVDEHFMLKSTPISRMSRSLLQYSSFSMKRDRCTKTSHEVKSLALFWCISKAVGRASESCLGTPSQKNPTFPKSGNVL